MYELANTYYTIYLGLKLLLIIIALVYLYNKGYKKPLKSSYTIFFFMGILAVCIFADVGDYWSYYRWYEGYDDEHIEMIWYLIKAIIPFGYDIFRGVVWGVGLLLYVRMCKKYNVDIVLALCLFSIFYIDFYNYARAAIAIIYVLFGFSLWYCNYEKRIKYYALALVFISVGVMMHVTMLLVLPAMLISLFLKLNKKSLITLSVLFPFISIFLNLYSNYFLTAVFGSDYVGEAALSYLSAKTEDTYFSVLLRRIPALFLYCISLVYLIGSPLSNQGIQRVSTAAFMIIYTAFLLTTISSANMVVPFYRALNMSYPLMLFTIAFTIKNIRSLKGLTIFMALFVLFELLLTIRVYILHPDFVIKQINDNFLI